MEEGPGAGGKRWYGGGRAERGGLGPGLRGFVVTCGGPEKAALQEAYRLLHETRDALRGEVSFGSVPPAQRTQTRLLKSGDREVEAEKAAVDASSGEEEEKEEEEEDILQSLHKECAEIKDGDSKSKRIFQVGHAAFANTKKEMRMNKSVIEGSPVLQQHVTKVDKVLFIGCRDAGLDVGAAAEALMETAAAAPKPLARFLLRLLPVHATTRAFPDDVYPASILLSTPVPTRRPSRYERPSLRS